ncbi:MAG: DUF1573 domain-containing protein [Planctomycetota bacterium]
MAGRLVLSAVLVMTFIADQSNADSWADAFFATHDHDFGKVLRGTTLNHQFVVTNTLPNEVRIKGLRVSCGCTRATASSMRIAPGESATIDATMETAGFQGSKSVTIFVQFDRPRRAEVPLRISCVSMGNINQGSSEVDFGIVPAGKEAVKRLNVDYVGDGNWKVVGLDYGNPNLRAEIVEVSRDVSAGKVRYELIITLAGTASPGAVEDQIRIHTTDATATDILVVAKAKVEADIVASPDSLRIAGVTPGQKVTKNIIVKAPSPFKVTRVDNAHGMFEIRSAPTPKTTQLVVVTLTVPQDPNTIPEHIDLVTDLENEKVISIGVKE